MSDITIPLITPLVAPHVAHHVHHAAVVAKTAAPHIHHGVSMITTFLIAVTVSIISSAVTWYIGHRGLNGVKADLANAKNEITKITTPSVTAPAV